MSNDIQPTLEQSHAKPDVHERQQVGRDERRWIFGLQRSTDEFPWQNTSSPGKAPRSRISDVSRYLQTGVAQGLYCMSCGTWNPEYREECSICGTALETVTEYENRKPIDEDISLVSIKEDGSDGKQIVIEYDETMIGRDADVSFNDDLFLSPRHALLSVKDGEIYVDDLNSLNGTFIKLQTKSPLLPGAVFLMGRQVLSFNPATDSRASRASDNQGTRYMGSPHPTGKYRLEQIGVGGFTLDVYSVAKEGVTIGRERGDIVFPRDKFMSSTHAKISPKEHGEGYMIEDLDSSNGTWIRTNEQTKLESGNFLFLGQQLFRIDHQS